MHIHQNMPFRAQNTFFLGMNLRTIHGGRGTPFPHPHSSQTDPSGSVPPFSQNSSQIHAYKSTKGLTAAIQAEAGAVRSSFYLMLAMTVSGERSGNNDMTIKQGNIVCVVRCYSIDSSVVVVSSSSSSSSLFAIRSMIN